MFKKTSWRVEMSIPDSTFVELFQTANAFYFMQDKFWTKLEIILV